MSHFAKFRTFLFAGAIFASSLFAADKIEIGALERVKVDAFAQLLSDATGRPFAVAGDIDAAFTVIVPNGEAITLPADEVYAFGLSVLASAGLSVVEEGDSCRIVRLPEGGGLSLGAVAPHVPEEGAESVANGGGLVTRVFRLQHVAADDVRKILEGGGGKKGWIAVLDSSNHLVVTDTARTLDRVAVLVEELDQPAPNRVTEVVILKNAAVDELAAQLNSIVSETQQSEGKMLSNRLQNDASAAALRSGVAVAAPHANAVILVGSAAQIAEFKSLITKLDVGAQSGRGRLRSIPLIHLKAEDTAKNITTLLEKSAAKLSDAKDVRRIAVEASVVNNALLVDASPQDFEVVQALIRELDVLPEQVNISVLIAEVADGSGFTWNFGFTALDTPAQPGQTRFSAGSRLTADTASLVDSASAGIFPQGITAAVAHGRGTDGAGNAVIAFPAVVSMDAVKENSDINILSETALQAQNNVEANVSIVDDIPILKSTIEGGSGSSRDVIQNIERLEVGVKLKFVPHVIPGGLVRMELAPSIESVISSGSNGGLTPTIAKRTAETTVTVPNSQTIVIAGLTRTTTQKVDKRVPVLGYIPVLGWLFRYKSEVTERTNLLIFVTPTIVSSPADAAAPTALWQQKTGIVPTPPTFEEEKSAATDE